MKIAVICANGKEGKLIVEEAIVKGADVTAVVRGENKNRCKVDVYQPCRRFSGRRGKNRQIHLGR